MKPIHILLVEDSEGDIMLTTDAFEDARIANTVSVTRDGEEAIHFLQQTGPHANAERPDLILLDINMPRKNGHEVLQFIKSDAHFKTIPVIMLTTSSSPNDIYNSYSEYANAYITKPIDIKDFFKVITTIESFWLQIAQLPGPAH